MRVSTTERILALFVFVTVAYRYATGNWPVEVEVQE